jgi:hypothetical protein
VSGVTKTCPNCGHEHDKKVTKCESCGGDMSKAKEEVEPQGLEEGAVLPDSDLLPVVESQATLIVPKKGKVFEQRKVEIAGRVQEVNVGRFAIIRPCMSRGRRIRGLAPIYEASMLAESAGVFGGWPMYADHITEQLKEAIYESLMEELGEEKVKALEGRLREAGRSIKDLGGRLLKTWFDPELVMEHDAERGYRKGGIVGDVVPQPFIHEMFEADPGVLNVSINAWPRRVKVGRPSWDNSQKGAVIEGIAAKPMGSVDFVFLGGAGGAPITEHERQVAVSVLASTYPSPRERNQGDEMPKKLAEMSTAEVRVLPKPKLLELLKEEGGESVAETIAEAIQLGNSGNGGSGSGSDSGALSEDAVQEMLAEHERKLREGFDESLKAAREEGDKELREREDARALESVAHDLLAEAATNGFPQAWVDQLKPRYTVTTAGIGSGLKLAESDLTNGEGEKVNAEDAMRERVKADIAEAIKLIEAGGGKPRVKGFGASAPDPQGEGKDKEGSGKSLIQEADSDAFIGFLRESGDVTGNKDTDEAAFAGMFGGS